MVRNRTTDWITIMNVRKFVIGHTSKGDDIVAWFVTDCFDNEELENGNRPSVVEFPVSQLYDSHEQQQRAQQYADFLNKIQEATQKAYEQTMLLDILKG